MANVYNVGALHQGMVEDAIDFFRSFPILKLLVLCVIILTVTGSAFATPSTNEHLDWNVGNFDLVYEENTGWKGVNGDETSMLIYAKQGETQDNWTITLHMTEMPIAITLMSKTRWNPESIMNAEKDRLLKMQCADVWTVIQQDETSILYERPNVNCPGYLHQHEIGRIVMGKWYLWWISYRIRNKILSEDEKSELAANLLKARMIE
jgi:hypothetical protein